MSWKRPPKVTSIELTNNAPFVRLVERRETKRDRTIAAGVFSLLTAGGLLTGALAVSVVTATLAGYLGNDVLNWEFKYDHPPEQASEVAA